jgi:hypothetical protein
MTRRILLVICLAAYWVPLTAHAQMCKGNINTGCTNAGAICKPVTSGTGPTGHCRNGGQPKGEKECNCVGEPVPPPPSFDPGCSDRTARGKFTCTIFQPKVTQHETDYPIVEFAPGDAVEVTANGCAQTGGLGPTWKRYVNPFGPKSDQYYHGLIRIPAESVTNGGLVRIRTVIGRVLHVSDIGLPLSQLYLHLGYEDDDYSDNGYTGHDDGTYGQCQITDADPSSGGPAYVVVTIYRGVTPDMPQSSLNFDVLSPEVDPNGLLFNPSWSWQLQPQNSGQNPSTSICHQFAVRGSTLGTVPDMYMSPYFADCTDQADLSTVDMPLPDNVCWVGTGPYFGSTIAGHTNWFPVTVEGSSDAVSHTGIGEPFSDDDYTFTFVSEVSGYPLSVNNYHGIHTEFDASETIDNYQDQSPNNEWRQLRDAVNNGGNVAQLFAGHTILTGMFGLDSDHNLKPELHPLFAMATRRDNFENSQDDEAWLIFVRTQGDEGYCSMSVWNLGLEDYTFRLPWRPGMFSVKVNSSKTFFAGTDGTSGPTVSMMRPTPGNAGGVYVTFHLGPTSLENGGASVPFVYGVLHLAWTGPITQPHPPIAESVAHAPATGLAVGAVGAQPAEADDTETALSASVKSLNAAQLARLRTLAVIPPTPAVRTHRLAATGPVQEIASVPRVLRVASPHAMNGGPATLKVQREAAGIRALCTVTNNAPPGLPAKVCPGPATQ